MTDPFVSLAERVQTDPFFLAAALETYRHSEDLDSAGLARRLGCREEELRLLALCRRPDASSPQYWSDIERIAARFGVELIILAEIVRRFEALSVWAEDETDAGWLQAARDRDGHENGRPE